MTPLNAYLSAVKNEQSEFCFNEDDFVPSLKALFEELPRQKDKAILVGITIEDSGANEDKMVHSSADDRGNLMLSDGKESWQWEVDSLKELFRGSKPAPSMQHASPPPEYQGSFILLELHVLEIIRAFGCPRDAEMQDIYSSLRRRPDGKSLGYLHDHMWRAAALMLGIRPLSQTEFEAIIGRLERSCRTFGQGPSSRNYGNSLLMTLGSGR